MQSVHFYCFYETTFADQLSCCWDFLANFCARLKRSSSSGQTKFARRPFELCRVLATKVLRCSGSRGSASCTTLTSGVIALICITMGVDFQLSPVRMWKVSYHDVCNNPKWSLRSRKTFNHGRLSIFQRRIGTARVAQPFCFFFLRNRRIK